MPAIARADEGASQATFPPNVRYVELYERAAREARNTGRGLPPTKSDEQPAL